MRSSDDVVFIDDFVAMIGDVTQTEFILNQKWMGNAHIQWHRIILHNKNADGSMCYYSMFVAWHQCVFFCVSILPTKYFKGEVEKIKWSAKMSVDNRKMSK